MNLKFLTCVLILSSIYIAQAADGVWIRKADFAGGERYISSSFTIGNKGYLVGGVTYPNSLHNDTWEYDLTTDTWAQKANYGGGYRCWSASFAIIGKGYVGAGIDTSNNPVRDFWQYDASSNIWTQKADYPDSVRGAAGFSIGNKGYFATGYNKTFVTNVLWEYDVATDKWTQKAMFPGASRYNAVGFSIGNKGYFGTGSNFGNSFSDFWEYDPALDLWTQKASFPSAPMRPIGFVVNGKGYLGVSQESREFCEYDASTNVWTPKESFPAAGSRSFATGFSIGNRGYVGLGGQADFWEFNPDSTAPCHHDFIINGVAVTNCAPIDSVSENCFGWSDSLCANSYLDVDLSISGGILPYTIKWQSLTANVNVSVSPFSAYSSQVCFNNTPGASELFGISITDASNCTTTVVCTLYTKVCPASCNYSGFELGNTTGWVCKSGTYGSGAWSGYCPANTPGTCPEFPTNLPTIGILNNNGINAPLNTGVDRHTIMTSAYLGTGLDSISHNTVPVVPSGPGCGTYSFRLGDAVGGGVGSNPNRLARAEAIKLSFLVTPSNNVFSFRYAVFLNDPSHLPQEQPRFDITVTDSNDSIVPGGYYHFVAGSSNPFCSGTRDSSTFKYGGTGSNAVWRFTDWTDACIDLSAYIGQTISAEFRTSDCFPNQLVSYSVAGVTTSCTNGTCCWGSPQTCTTLSVCTHSPGLHSAYAYIDAYCGTTVPPNTLKDTTICLGDTIELTMQASVYSWAPSAGLSDIYSNNPKAYPTITTTYTAIVFGVCGEINRSVTVTVLPLSTCITGLNKNEVNDIISVYPNPSASSFTLKFNAPLKDAEVIIFDLLGKEMMRKRFSGNRMEIERGSLERGVYFVKVIAEEKQYVQKIIVE